MANVMTCSILKLIFLQKLERETKIYCDCLRSSLPSLLLLLPYVLLVSQQYIISVNTFKIFIHNLRLQSVCCYLPAYIVQITIIIHTLGLSTLIKREFLRGGGRGTDEEDNAIFAFNYIVNSPSLLNLTRARWASWTVREWEI